MPLPYRFRHRDPVIDQLVALARAAGVSPREWATASGVSRSVIYKLNATVRGSNRIQQKGVMFATAVRLCYGLGVSLASIEQRRTALRVVQAKALKVIAS